MAFSSLGDALMKSGNLNCQFFFVCVCLFPCGEGAFFLAAMKLPLT